MPSATASALRNRSNLVQRDDGQRFAEQYQPFRICGKGSLRMSPQCVLHWKASSSLHKMMLFERCRTCGYEKLRSPEANTQVLTQIKSNDEWGSSGKAEPRLDTRSFAFASESRDQERLVNWFGEN
jgi:hypothetical protein